MIVEIWVKPGSKKGNLVQPGDEGEPWTVFVTAKAVDGEANEAVISLLADFFKVQKRRVLIKSGHRSRRKLIEVKSQS